MSQDIGDTCLGSSATPSPGSMLGHVESSPGHHRPLRRPPDPGRGRRPLRRAPRLGLQAQGPLRDRGRHGVGAPLPTPQDLPDRPVDRGGRPRRADPQGTDRRGTGRRPRDHRLAPRAPPRPPGGPINHQPPPDPLRVGHPRTQEATQVLLHPVPGIPNRTRPGSPTSPTTGSPTPTAGRASRWRSSAGSTTAPATPYTCLHIAGSPPRSWSGPSAKPLPPTGSPPPRSPTTRWSTPSDWQALGPGAHAWLVELPRPRSI